MNSSFSNANVDQDTTSRQAHQPATRILMDDDISLATVFNILRRDARIIAACTVTIFLLGAYYAFFVAAPVYNSSSLVASDVPFDQSLEGTPDLLQVLKLNTEVEVIKSYEALGHVVDRLDLVGDPEFNVQLKTNSARSSEAATRSSVINALLNRVSVINLTQSFVFKLTVTTSNSQKSAQIANALADVYVEQQAGRNILRPAVAQGAIAPRKSRILLVSLVLGFMAGAGLVMIREMFRTTVRTGEDLEAATGLSVLGQIPRLPADTPKDILNYADAKPLSLAVESVRNLQISTLHSDPEGPPRIILVTSSMPGEGKMAQSVLLAQSLSKAGKKVLLVEGDIRGRQFADAFGPAPEQGLIAAITQQATLADLCVPCAGFGFDLLRSEPSAMNKSNLFMSDGVEAVLAEAKALYDHVIVVAPPVLVVSDARIMASWADAILFLVKSNSTTKAQILAGLRAFSSVNAPVTGLVLTDARPVDVSRHSRAYYKN